MFLFLFGHTQDGQMTSDGEDISELTRESWEVSHMFSTLSFLFKVKNAFSDNAKTVSYLNASRNYIKHNR